MKGKWKLKSGYCGCDRYMLSVGIKCPYCQRRMPGAKLKKKSETRKVLREEGLLS